MAVKNQALLTEKAELRRQGQLAEQTEQELAKKSQVFQKTIKNLVRQLVVSIHNSLIALVHVVGGTCLVMKSQDIQKRCRAPGETALMLSALMEFAKRRCLTLHVVVVVTPEMADKELLGQGAPAEVATVPISSSS